MMKGQKASYKLSLAPDLSITPESRLRTKMLWTSNGMFPQLAQINTESGTLMIWMKNISQPLHRLLDNLENTTKNIVRVGY